MSEVSTTLGAGVLASSYAPGDGTMLVTPSVWPDGLAFPATGTFSISAKFGPGPKYPVYTVSAVTPSGGNKIFTLTLEAGTDTAGSAGAIITEVATTRSLAAAFAPGPIVPVANGGTGTNVPSLVAGTGVSITGAWPNQTVAVLGGGGGAGAGFNPTTQTDVTGSRAIGTVFENTTAFPIWVDVITNTGIANLDAQTDSANPPTTFVASTAPSGPGNVTVGFIVLPGNFYKITSDGVLVAWIEWSGGPSSSATYKYSYMQGGVALSTPSLSPFPSGLNGETSDALRVNSPTASATGGPGLLPFSADGAVGFFPVRLPATWDGSPITLDIDGLFNVGAAAGTGIFACYSVGLSVGDNTDAVTWSAPSASDSKTGGGTTFPNFPYTSWSLAVPLTGLVAGQLVYIAVARQTDTFTSTLFLIGISVGIKY